ncbi:unnamed protein product [Cylicostephanus goldi]|uniref:Uncharacterized protein n=1 Tax=Cylicostephanus goldi TaxID=71465 RepID=A0A3P6SFC7_CYLGO|nr:unnamed protein product [Cylicostephanus goldi]
MKYSDKQALTYSQTGNNIKTNHVTGAYTHLDGGHSTAVIDLAVTLRLFAELTPLQRFKIQQACSSFDCGERSIRVTQFALNTALVLPLLTALLTGKHGSAKLDLIAIKQRRWETSYTTSDSLRYILESKELRARHIEEKRELYSWSDQLLVAHEWYEILIGADEAEEIDRVMFLNELEETVVQVPTRPGELGYPEPKQVLGKYKQDTIGSILDRFRIGYNALLHDEAKETYEVEQEIKRGNESECRLLQEMYGALTGLETELQCQREAREWSQENFQLGHAAAQGVDRRLSRGSNASKA